MKRVRTIIILTLCVFLFSACSSEPGRGAPAFKTDNISSVYLTSANPNTQPAIVADEYIDEICRWLSTFTIGKRAEEHRLEPGANSVGVIIEYFDGSVVETGIDAMRLGDELYYLKREPVPDCVSKILD